MGTTGKEPKGIYCGTGPLTLSRNFGPPRPCVMRYSKRLELLPHLCDEHGNPWNAAQLVHDVQAA
jgi:hypothetical protein